MTDPTLFSAGALFSQDYLIEGIQEARLYTDVDPADLRKRLSSILAGFPHASKPNEATTESDLVWPILRELGWEDYLTQQNLSPTGRVDVPDGLLFISPDAKARANQHPEEWLRYQHGSAVVESKRWGRALDRAELRSGPDKDTPSTQLLRYLRKIDDRTNGELRWGILTNGAKWRLYFSGARSTIDDYLEIDLAAIMGLAPDLLDTGVRDEDREHWLRVFVAMFSRPAFERPGKGAPSFHDKARSEAAFYEERVARNLSDLVFNQLYPALGKAVAQAAPAETSLDEVRQSTLILLYRLLFVLYAEDRGLLPIKDKRFDDYALRVVRLDVGKRKDAGDPFSSVARTYWNRFADLAEMIDKGDPSVGMPPYNGGLFNADQTPLLKMIALPDSVMADAIDILSWERRATGKGAGQRRYINYRDLSVQQLGSIYERLLEFELTRDETTGEVDIRPNTFARKNSGSYYTPDELVLLILDETLEPLVADAMETFRQVLDAIPPSSHDEGTIVRIQKADPARAITRLRICDPAMGSGHFLVSLVDRLSNHTLNALAEAHAMVRQRFPGLEYQSPVAEEITKIRGTIRHNADESGWAINEEQLNDPQLVKRMILKRCIFGADKNPMAVELAKVALWLHTFTVGAPLSFIDHHLAAGDSLFGLWVDDAIAKAGKGAGLLFLHQPIANAQLQARAMRLIEKATDAEVAEAHASAAMWRDVELQTGPLDGFINFIHALEWLNIPKADKPLITIWLDGRFGDPIKIAQGVEAPEPFRAKEDEVVRFLPIWEAARQLIEEERFLNWQVTFPGVWDDWTNPERQGGFDAIVGNPPWDRIKLQQVEWFAARRPEIAKAQRASDRGRLIKDLEKSADPLFADYAKADRRASDTMRIARKGGSYPLLSRGDINLYSLFVERAHALVKPGGIVGLLTPSGIASDLSASEFFRKVSTGGHLKALYDFENKKVFFPDVHASFKFCIMVASPQRVFDAAQCAFYLHRVSELNNPEQAFPISATDFARVNPNTGTAPIFRNRRDMALTTAVYANCPVLVDRSGPTELKSWPISYVRMFDMANDSHLFRTKVELEEREGAWPIESNRWASAAGEWVPLYQGRTVEAYDHRFAGIDFNPENIRRGFVSISTTTDQHSDPAFAPQFQFFVPYEDCRAVFTGSYLLAYRRSTATTNSRTMVSAIAPHAGYGDSLFLLCPERTDCPVQMAWVMTALQANLMAIPFDFVSRNKLQGQNFSWYILEQLPVIPPAAYARTFGPKTAEEIVREAVLELTYTAHDMAPFARDMGYVDDSGDVLPPFTWDEDRRLQLRAKLDALYFILYGVIRDDNLEQGRDDISYIYSTFPIVERQETERWGSYRSRDLCLAWVNALRAGQPDAKIGI